MFVTTLSILLLIIFSILSGLHFYWLFGGVWGLSKSIPTKNNKELVLKISKVATLIVAIVLGLVGLLYFSKLEFINFHYTHWMLDYSYWIIPIIFILRAVGDFNYVGIFKKIKDTEFAKADSKIVIPLCLIIGICGVTIQLLLEN